MTQEKINQESKNTFPSISIGVLGAILGIVSAHLIVDMCRITPIYTGFNSANIIEKSLGTLGLISGYYQLQSITYLTDQISKLDTQIITPLVVDLPYFLAKKSYHTIKYLADNSIYLLFGGIGGMMYLNQVNNEINSILELEFGDPSKIILSYTTPYMKAVPTAIAGVLTSLTGYLLINAKEIATKTTNLLYDHIYTNEENHLAQSVKNIESSVEKDICENISQLEYLAGITKDNEKLSCEVV